MCDGCDGFFDVFIEKSLNIALLLVVAFTQRLVYI